MYFQIKEVNPKCELVTALIDSRLTLTSHGPLSPSSISSGRVVHNIKVEPTVLSGQARPPIITTISAALLAFWKCFPYKINQGLEKDFLYTMHTSFNTIGLF